MSDAELNKIADDAVTLISGASFSLSITESRRCYVPRLTKESLRDLRVYVMPIGEEGVRAAKRVFSYIYTLQLVIAKWVETSEPEHVDPLVGFTQEVADFLRNARFPTTSVVENGVELTPFDHDKLKDEKIYLSLITLKLEGLRDV